MTPYLFLNQHKILNKRNVGGNEIPTELHMTLQYNDHMLGLPRGHDQGYVMFTCLRNINNKALLLLLSIEASQGYTWRRIPMHVSVKTVGTLIPCDTLPNFW